MSNNCEMCKIDELTERVRDLENRVSDVEEVVTATPELPRNATRLAIMGRVINRPYRTPGIDSTPTARDRNGTELRVGDEVMAFFGPDHTRSMLATIYKYDGDLLHIAGSSGGTQTCGSENTVLWQRKEATND